MALPTLGLGPFGPGVQDGAAPFNTEGSCANAAATAVAGDDCGESNNQVRSQDTVVFNWSITANNYTPGQTNPKNVVLEQILHPSIHAVVGFSRIPVRCMPIGGGGATPASAITTENNGDIKLVCNLGEFAEGDQLSFSTVAEISGTSWNGETFTSTQRIYSNASDGTPNAVTATQATIGPISISSRPMVDLSSSIFHGYYLYGARDVGQGVENGYYTWVNMRLASAQKAGTEAIKQPFSYGFNLSATKNAVNGVDYTNSGFEYYMIDCRYNSIGWSGNVYGRESYGASNLTAYPLKRKVIESGTCAYVRDTPSNPSSPYTLTISNTDLSGTRYPTEALGGIDLKAGPFYYMDMLARFFIPMRVIDNSDGIINGTGSIYIKNILTNFDPVSVSGTLNYGGVKEPGFNGNPMPDSTISNNIAPAYHYYLTTRGTWADYAFKTNQDTGSGYSFFVPSSSHSGQGLLAPTQAYPNTIHFGNNGSTSLSNPRACIAFDNSIQTLTDRSKTGGTAGTYAYVGTYTGAGFDATNYIVEYGHVDLTGDDTLDKDGDGNNDYNNQTGRYEGNWTKVGSLRCDDTLTTWKTDPTQVGTSINDVNIVRARLKTSVQATVKLDSSQYIRFIVPLQIRENFYQGAHDGDPVPMGAVAAAFGSVRSDEWATNWTPGVTSRPYKPAPETGNSDGDRVTIARTTARLDSESLLPAAQPGKTANTIAGKQIVWKITTAIQSLLATTVTEKKVQIIDELPPTASYNKNCTINYSDANGNVGTVPSLVNYNTDRNGNPKTGYTQLIWNLGTVNANVAIAPRVICTDSDPLAPNGATVVNYAEIRGDTLISALSQRSDTHTITLEQIGSIQVSKIVDMRLDDVNDTQVHTIKWANFAASFAIDPPTIIDVFPFNGDDSSNSPRSPKSKFKGILSLTSAPNITWLNGATDGAPLGVWHYTTDTASGINYDPDNNHSNWVLEAALGGDFSSVTAIKFVSNYALAKDGDPHQGMKASFTLQAGDTADPSSANANKPGDIYTNLFTLDTPSLPTEQFLRSNTVSVSVASYSIGDLIFADTDGDLKYTAGSDIPAPDGIVVELYKASDNSLVSTTTTGTKGAGRYLFADIGSGDYYIVIPASQFANGAVLKGWNSLVTAAGNDDDKNDELGQDGYTTGTVVNNGVRTHVFTLSAIPPLPGALPKGNEPLSDNTGGIVDNTGDDFSNHTIDIGLKPALDYGDAPLSYGDAGHGVGGIPKVYLGALYPDTEGKPQHSANGGIDGLGDDQAGVQDEDSIQLLPPLRTHDTRFEIKVATHNSSTKNATVMAWIDFNNNGIFEASEATSARVNPEDGGTKSLVWNAIPAGTIQAGNLWLRVRISTDTNLAANNASVPLFDGEMEDYQLNPKNGVRVSGFVFNDENVSGGIKETNEKGISKVTVVLHNTTSNTCTSIKTNGQGYYQFSGVLAGSYTLYEAAYETVTTPKTCPSIASDLKAYRSTTANNQAITVANVDISQQDFGDVLSPLFSPNNSKTILAGNTVFYPHRFTPRSTGTVSFSSANSGNTVPDWINTLYRDDNCNGILDGKEANVPIINNLAATANNAICLINSVYAPNNVINGERYQNLIRADFNFNNNALAGISVLNVRDVSKANVSTSSSTDSKLELRKSVQNITQNGTETETQNQAKPSDVLKYRIYYSNQGAGVITDLKINDIAQEFTLLQGGSATCDTTPAGLNCSPVENDPDVKWLFTGSLKGGAKGVVSYQVQVE